METRPMYQPIAQTSKSELDALASKVKRGLVPMGLLVVFVMSAMAIASEEGDGWWPAKGSVSIVALISSPRSYSGTRIRTTGIATIEFEESMLYLNPYDAEHHLFENGVWLAIDHSQAESFRRLDHQLVEVEGIYDFPVKGSYWACPNGAITKITMFEARNVEANHPGGPLSKPH